MSGYFNGLEPQMLPLTPVSDPAVDALAWGGVLVALMVFPTVNRVWRMFLTSLTRTESKLPAAERTIGERLSQVAGILLCCLMWGILLYSTAFGVRQGQMNFTPGSGMALTAAACLGSFLLQLLGYCTVGYVFTTGVSTRSWIRALTATQSMLAYWVMIPAIGALLFPSAAVWLAVAGVVIFVLFRMLLWVKGFKIFYTGPFSVFYFFLYLCTLETVPLLLPVGVALVWC